MIGQDSYSSRRSLAPRCNRIVRLEFLGDRSKQIQFDRCLDRGGPLVGADAVKDQAGIGRRRHAFQSARELGKTQMPPRARATDCPMGAARVSSTAGGGGETRLVYPGAE